VRARRPARSTSPSACARIGLRWRPTARAKSRAPPP
jgi:hypothetical protein